MTLSDISYSGLLKLALLFIITPRVFSQIFSFVTEPAIEKISEFRRVTSIKDTPSTETIPQSPVTLYEFAVDQILFIFTLFVSVYILTKIIKFLAENTKLGNMNLGERPK